MARLRIVPFKCEECGGEFDETAGGICRSCAGGMYLIISVPTDTRVNGV